MKIERTKNAVRNMMWGYIYRVISTLMPFVLRTEMLYLLGAQYVGVSGLFTSVLQVLNLSELGFSQAVVYHMYKPIAEDDHAAVCALLNYYRRVYLAVGAVVLGAGTVLTPFIPHLISGEVPADINIYVVYYLFLLNTAASYFLFAYRGALLNAFQRNDLENKVMIGVTLFRYLLEIAVVYFTRRYLPILFIELAATVLNNVLKYRVTQKEFPGYRCEGTVDADKRKAIRTNVKALLFHKIGGVVLNSGDNIVISAFLGLVMVSNYGNYYYIMMTVESFILVGFAGMTAGIGNSFAVEANAKNRGDFRKVLFFNAWLVGWCSTCLLCLYQDAMRLWVGEEYMLPDTMVYLIVLYFFSHNIRRTIITFRDGAGMWQDNRFQPLCAAAVNLLVNVILVQWIGLAGVLISSIFSIVAIDIPWESAAFCKRIEMKQGEYIGLLLYYAGVCATAVLATFLPLRALQLAPLYNIFLKMTVCLVLPNLVLWLFLHGRDEYGYFVQLVGGYTGRFRRRHRKP